MKTTNPGATGPTIESRRRNTIDPAIAMTRFETGPAAATQASARRPPRSIDGLTGVGFAQPMMKPPRSADATSRSEPNGSRWTIGLSVRRPNIFAVPSPSRYATSAWLNSWTGKPTRRKIATATSVSGWICRPSTGTPGTGGDPAYGSPGGLGYMVARMVVFLSLIHI